ncbi:MAG: rhamnulokinase family protein [Anaerolineaceae bacterium]|jgi:rhamnulokinase
MQITKNLLAIDLGAESGRAILGQLDGSRLVIREVHRFANTPVLLLDGLHWDVLRLFGEIKHSIAAAIHETSGRLDGIGLDTWGVDFGLLDRQGTLLANPYHYRDSRTDGMLQAAFARMPKEQIFNLTGIQFMQLNSLFQLLAMAQASSPLLEIAETFLTMPDLFNYWLTGQKGCEFTIATTTQCYNPRTRAWAEDMLARLGIPSRIFPRVIPTGSVLAYLLPTIANEIGATAIPVIAPACHDTASAVAAVPAQGDHYAWISSGTWSIIGVSVKEPVINAQSLAYNFTNEGGVNNTYRLSRNVMGLWLVQESRRTWEHMGQSYTYDELTRRASGAPALQSIIDPDSIEFLKPGNMPARIRAFCERTEQPQPEDVGAVVRCTLESIALRYRWVIERLEELLGRRLDTIHIVGGGTKNRLLSQLTADATGRPVITGPIEATAAGNLLVQAMAIGELSSPDDLRAIVCRSFPVETFHPAPSQAWDDAYHRFTELAG